jgi:tetratricopeptide (TPR) repeat protein
LNLDELDKNLSKVNQYDIGLIKFFTYLFTARYYKKYNQKKSYDYYVASMEFLKWHYPLDKETLFSMTFNEATPIGYELEKYDTLSYFLDKNLQLKKDLNIAFNVNHYYNLALFYNSNNEFEKAIEIANTYISLAKEITTGDLVDALIIKAIGYSSLNEIRDSILLYEECIRMTENTEFMTQYALCLSNALHCISYHELASHQHLIKPYETALLDVLKQEFSDSVSISNLYSNLGLSQTYLKDYDKAIYYFEKAFKIIEDKQSMSKEIPVLEESFNAFHHKHKLEQYITYVRQVDYESLEDRAKIKFMKVLLRLQQIIIDNKPLNTYINQFLASK